MIRLGDRERDALLLLVRAAVRPSEDFSLDCLPPDLDWESVLGASYRQGVIAVISDGYQRCVLGGGKRRAVDGPSGGMKMKWLSYIVSTEESYREQMKVISDLSRFYGEHGVRLMILKGYGLSLDYPVPNHRNPGDIDTYNFGDWKRADDALSTELGVTIDYSHHHHSVFHFEKQSVENHYDIINTKAHRGSASLDRILKDMAGEGYRAVDVLGQTVYLPSATFNAVFLMRHLGSHFAGSSINLRQLLDWAMFVDKHSQDVDWDRVLDVTGRFGQTSFMGCVDGLCMDCFGIDTSKFPQLERNGALEKKILDDIFNPLYGDAEPAGKVARLTFRLRRWLANIWKHRLVYNEKLVPMFLTLAISHMRKPDIKLHD